MNTGTKYLLEMLTERISSLSAEGRWDDALGAADAAVEKAQQSDDGETANRQNLSAILELKADVLRHKGELEEAKRCYIEALSLVDNEAEQINAQAKLNATVGVISDQLGDDQDAIIYYEKAIELYERLDPPELLEVADICNNLGFIYRNLDDVDTAETLLLKGLEICHSELGSKHEKTATLCNNVGALYLRSGYDQQAREMHAMALEGRLASLGEDHPDTAQSYSNLGLSLAQLGELEMSKEHFQKSLSIYENYLESEASEYAVVTENYSELLRIMGDDAEADEVIKKAQKKLANDTNSQ